MKVGINASTNSQRSPVEAERGPQSESTVTQHDKGRPDEENSDGNEAINPSIFHIME